MKKSLSLLVRGSLFDFELDLKISIRSFWEIVINKVSGFLLVIALFELKNCRFSDWKKHIVGSIIY
jgi:hypothetical protein